MADIFISYSRKDQDFVAHLHAALRTQQRGAWVDWEGIPPSAEWMQVIRSAIDSAIAVVFVITPASVASAVCGEEIAYAVARSKRLVPLLRQEVNDATVPAAVRERNWIAFREADDFAAALGSLIKALDTDLEWVAAHTRLLTRAVEWDANRRDASFALRGSDLRRAEQYLAHAPEKTEPQLVTLQVEYILDSRRAAGRRQQLTTAAAGLGLAVVLILAIAFWAKRQETQLEAARNLFERGFAALRDGDPQQAEVLLAHSLATADRQETRELALEARARAAQLVATLPSHHGILSFSSGLSQFVVQPQTRTIEVWDAGKIVPRRRILSDEDVVSAELSPDGRLLALNGETAIELWHLDSPATVPDFTLAASGVLTMSFGPAGGLLAFGGKDRTVGLWDIASQQQAVRRLVGHQDQIQCLAIDAGQGFVVSGSWDNTLKVWDIATGVLRHTLAGHGDAVLSVAISADGELIASGGWDNQILLWDARTGQRLRDFNGHQGGVRTLAFSPDGSMLASGSEDRTARLWDVETGRLLLTLGSNGGVVTSVGFTNDGGRSLLAVADESGTVRRWNLDCIGERPEITTFRGHQKPVSAVAFSPDGLTAASGSWDRTVRLWNLAARTPSGPPLSGHTDAVTAVTISGDGRQLASAGKDGTVRLWDLQTRTGQILTGGGNGSPVKLRDIAFSPAAPLLAAAGDDGVVRLWSLTDGGFRSFKPHDDKVLGLAFSPDGQVLATAGEDHTIRLSATKDGALLHVLAGHGDTVWSVAFSPDGQYLASASDDRSARLWSAATGLQVAAPLEHAGSVWSVAFSSDGHTIATGSQDASVQLWDLHAEHGRITVRRSLTLHVSDGPVWAVRFNRDATMPLLAIAGADATLRVWNPAEAAGILADPPAMERMAEDETGLHFAAAGGQPGQGVVRPR